MKTWLILHMIQSIQDQWYTDSAPNSSTKHLGIDAEIYQLHRIRSHRSMKQLGNTVEWFLNSFYSSREGKDICWLKLINIYLYQIQNSKLTFRGVHTEDKI